MHVRFYYGFKGIYGDIGDRLDFVFLQPSGVVGKSLLLFDFQRMIHCKTRLTKCLHVARSNRLRWLLWPIFSRRLIQIIILLTI